jgi:hypothetical protein
MKRFSNVWLFFATALVAFLAITALWMQVNAWTSIPAAKIAAFALEKGAPAWVRSANVTPGLLEVETRIEVHVPGQQRNKGIAELVAEIDPSHYAYGLPLLLALLLAARSRRLLRNAAIGYALLQFTQAFSLVFGVLKQILQAAGGMADLQAPQWQIEAIVLCYQFSSLLLPALAPALIWLWLEKSFFAAVIVDGMLSRATQEIDGKR